MTNVAHKDLTGANLHEPKGADTATSGKVYISNGSGSGAWTTIGAQGLVPIAYKNASSQANLDFVHGTADGNGNTIVLDSTYKVYKLFISGLHAATNDSQLYMRIGTGAGPSYQTSGYDTQRNVSINGSFFNSGAVNADAGYFQLNSTGYGLNSGASAKLNCEITMYSLGTTDNFMSKYDCLWFNTGNVVVYADGYVGYEGSTAVTGIRFGMFVTGASATTSVQNISAGRFALYGIRNTP